MIHVRECRLLPPKWFVTLDICSILFMFNVCMLSHNLVVCSKMPNYFVRSSKKNGRFFSAADSKSRCEHFDTTLREHTHKKPQRIILRQMETAPQERIPKVPPPRRRHGAKIEWRQPVGHIFIWLFFVCVQMCYGKFVVQFTLSRCSNTCSLPYLCFHWII